jgi:hypothetical protein
MRKIESTMAKPRGLLRPHEQTIARRMGDGMILLQLRTNRIFELNTTAARLWDLIVSNGNWDEIIETLLSEFEVESAELESEVDQIVASLLEAEVITLHASN